MRFTSFKTFLEVTAAGESNIFEIPFQANGKDYIMRLFGQPTYKLFSYSIYRKGTIYEITWFPRDAQKDDLWKRTGDNSVGGIRELLNTIKTLATQKIMELNPVGFFFKGADKDLDRFWKKFTRNLDFQGYVLSRTVPYIYVKAELKDKIDTQDFDQD